MARKRRRSPPARTPLPWDELCPSLDLHGETAESARRIAERWLREHQADNVPVVRVITGRGRRSLGPPVLRGEIEDLLTVLRGTVVSTFASESAGGAFRVELRKPPRPRPARAAEKPRPTPLAGPTAGADAELRRRAEESLVELGIALTPALVKAEMRRIKKAEAEGGQ